MAASDLPRLLRMLEHVLSTEPASIADFDNRQVSSDLDNTLLALEKEGSCAVQSAAVR